MKQQTTKSHFRTTKRNISTLPYSHHKATKSVPSHAIAGTYVPYIHNKNGEQVEISPETKVVDSAQVGT